MGPAKILTAWRHLLLIEWIFCGYANFRRRSPGELQTPVVFGVRADVLHRWDRAEIKPGGAWFLLYAPPPSAHTVEISGIHCLETAFWSLPGDNPGVAVPPHTGKMIHVYPSMPVADLNNIHLLHVSPDQD